MHEAIQPGVKMIFLCSPNNPTGTSIEPQLIMDICSKFQGLVVLDEAYIDFSSKPSLIPELKNFQNLVILQTFSKAWGLASLRLGMLFAHVQIIDILNKIKPPYNINGATQELALNALENLPEKNKMVKDILKERKLLISMLSNIAAIEKIYPSDANFLLVKIENAHEVYRKLIDKKVIVRDRSSVTLCEDCLRITVGTNKENQQLIKQLNLICN